VPIGRTTGSRRERGSIDVLPSGARRVRVYAGVDPVTTGAETALALYRAYVGKHISPYLGRLKVGALDAATSDGQFGGPPGHRAG